MPAAPALKAEMSVAVGAVVSIVNVRAALRPVWDAESDWAACAV